MDGYLFEGDFLPEGLSTELAEVGIFARVEPRDLIELDENYQEIGRRPAVDIYVEESANYSEIVAIVAAHSYGVKDIEEKRTLSGARGWLASNPGVVSFMRLSAADQKSQISAMDAGQLRGVVGDMAVIVSALVRERLL